MHRNTERVVAAASAKGLDVDPVTYPEGTRTAEDAARAIGVGVGQIVKSLVFDLEDDEGRQPVLALVSGSNRLDEAKLAAVAGAHRAVRADADRVREITGYPIGGVPPFGHPDPVKTFVDPDLLAYDEVWAAGGTPQVVFGLAPQDLVEITGAVVAELST